MNALASCETTIVGDLWLSEFTLKCKPLGTLEINKTSLDIGRKHLKEPEKNEG